jgi:hypothetical protein
MIGIAAIIARARPVTSIAADVITALAGLGIACVHPAINNGFF